MLPDSPVADPPDVSEQRLIGRRRRVSEPPGTSEPGLDRQQQARPGLVLGSVPDGNRSRTHESELPAQHGGECREATQEQAGSYLWIKQPQGDGLPTSAEYLVT